MLDGIRTRNPQIRSLMRYPLRHERKTRAETTQTDPTHTKSNADKIFCTHEQTPTCITDPVPTNGVALVAQWIAHQTSNLGVAGSNPVEHIFEWAVGLVV